MDVYSPQNTILPQLTQRTAGIAWHDRGTCEQQGCRVVYQTKIAL